MTNEALDKLRAVGSDWRYLIKEIIAEEKYDYLTSSRKKKDLYRISVLPRLSWRGDGFGDYRESSKLNPSRNELLFKVFGYCNGKFNLGNNCDEFHNVVHLIPGYKVRESTGFNSHKLEEMVSEVAENYRGSDFDKSFLKDVLSVSNDYLEKIDF